MKIRIKGNSLRYRLTKSDISNFVEDGYLEEQTHFGGQTLTYAIQRSTCGQLLARFENNIITLFMPSDQVNEWDATERVGFQNNNNGLFLLVEKDFKCLDNVAEDQSDNYPNPLAAQH